MGSYGFSFACSCPCAACSSAICNSLRSGPQSSTVQRMITRTNSPDGTPHHGRWPNCLPRRSITTDLRGYDALERFRDNVKHRLLRLNQGINAILECISGRVVGDAELFLGGFAGRFVLLRIVVKSFLLRCDRMLD